MTREELKYPIGKYQPPAEISASQVSAWIEEIAALPALLRATVNGLSDQQLETPYREGGWSVRQTVHHVPDSHMQAYCRFKLALTEDGPAIKPYEEALWAELGDSAATPISVSLNLLEALHLRWVALLKSMQPSDFKRAFFHPEHGIQIPLDYVTGLYAWHGKHHTTQIQRLKERMNW